MSEIRRIALLAALLVATVAAAKLPQRNMTVELRVVSQEAAGSRGAAQIPASSGLVLRSQPPQEDEPEIQKVFVLNGERAFLKLDRQTPFQWVKSAVTQSSSRSGAAGDVGSQEARGVEQALQWMQSARGLSVQVRWPGGRQAAALDIHVETAGEDVRAGQNLPGQSRSHFATTVLVPLGEWSTLAVTGTRVAPEQAGVYSTRALESGAVKLLQVRVLAP